MAKAKKEVVVEPQIKKEVVTKKKKVTTPHLEDGWKIQDRTYKLKRGLSPLTYTVRSRGIYYFDEIKGYERELKFTLNQRTPFVDEFKGDSRLGHIVFEDGILYVPKEKVTLQKLLSLYHPDRNRVFEEHNPVTIAKDELVDIELEIEALNVARNLDIDTAEAVLRVEQGSNVSNLTSKEIKRDVLLYSRHNPKLFLELVNDDNVHLRNMGIKAVESGLLNLSVDNRYFTWKDTDRKVMTVPYDEHPYSALASWFKTDEGLEVYKNLEKRLK